MRMHGISHYGWLDRRYFPMAAGDDLAILVRNGEGDLVTDIQTAIAKSTSSVKSSDVPVGLG